MGCMNMKGAEFAELTALVAVATERSFRRAAEKLGVSPSAISHTIAALEQRLGARLLNRTTRSVAPTEAGLALVERLRSGMAEIDEAVRAAGASQDVPKGVVRINLPRIAAQLVIIPRMAAFLQSYPDVRIELVIDDSITDVVARGFDAGMRSGDLVQQDMVAIRMTPDLRMAVVGAPAYLAGRTLPAVPDDLRAHACLTYRWSDTGALYRWRFTGPDGEVDVNVVSAMTANDTDMLLSAALGGAGLAFIPESLVAPFLQSGELVRMLDAWCRPFAGFYLYYPSRAYMPAPLRAFIDFFRPAVRSPDAVTGQSDDTLEALANGGVAAA
jgi:DNA-binding transcriptional LysR family regulator